MIEAVIFDMDGVLIDSEPFWKKSEQKIFATVGIELTKDLCMQTTGFDGMSTIRYWYAYKPWKNKSFEQVKKEIEDDVLSQIDSLGMVKEGVVEILKKIRDKNLKKAIASSSPQYFIEKVIAKLGIIKYFDLIQSSELLEAGKPHPAVYIHTARLLNIKPENCLAIEDSINGLIAAKKAGMKTIAIPDSHLKHDKRYSEADLVVDSLVHFDIDSFIKGIRI
jgi:mannitol-1-/sugar-/sorbitol-6-/2-deoxyglucose-6-phosphatase